MEKNKIFLTITVLVAAVIIIVYAGQARAATFAVNSTADVTDVSPGNGICETAPGNGICTLRAAIMEANALAGADTILVPSGVYRLTIPGSFEDACATGDLDITSDLIITGYGASTTVIDGNGIDAVFHLLPGASATINGITVTKGFYGGIVNDGTLTLSDSIITANAGNGYAGGLGNTGTATLTNVIISNNTASSSSGGINNNRGTMTISNSTISGNIAQGNAGGIRAFGGNLTMVNSTISGNKAYGGGGGISMDSTPVVTLQNVTITANTADEDNDGVGDGGGIDAYGTLNVKNTIIAGNIDKGGQAPDCTGTINSLDYNLIQNTAGCTVSGTTTHNITGIDPLVGPLANNGGVTLTHALSATSPAINAGDNAGAPAADQRGVTRAPGTIDIGAYEYQVMPLPTSSSFYSYSSSGVPVLDPTPSNAKPVTAGKYMDSAYSGGMFNFSVGFLPFSGPVDIYLALQVDGSIFLVGPDLWFAPLSSMVAWRTNVSTPIYEVIYSNLPLSFLKAGTYYIYTLATPTGSFGDYYLWGASFEVH